MTRPRPLVLTAIYALTAIVMTWPLVTHLTRSIAWDLADPLFNSWVLQWTSGVMLEALHGHPGALHHYWQGNIFALRR